MKHLVKDDGSTILDRMNEIKKAERLFMETMDANNIHLLDGIMAMEILILKCYAYTELEEKDFNEYIERFKGMFKSYKESCRK